jgi:hypothetical protein
MEGATMAKMEREDLLLILLLGGRMRERAQSLLIDICLI